MERLTEKLMGAAIALAIVSAAFPLLIAIDILFSPALYYLIKNDKPPLLDSKNPASQVIYYMLVTWFYMFFIAALAAMMFMLIGGIMEALGLPRNRPKT